MPTVSRGLFCWLFQSDARLEDFADRLNHVWTFGLLLILGAIISWKYEFGEPISCWTPVQFSPATESYVHQACWHHDMHYFPFTDTDIPGHERRDLIKTYYQWIPVVLCLQALLFKLPNIILYILHGYSGVDFDKVNGLTIGYNRLNISERQNLANQLARYIYRWCSIFPRGLPWRLLTAIWFFVKCLYCINIIIQMVYIDKFLKIKDGPHYNSTSYGDTIYENLFADTESEWRVSPAFPRLIMCDLSVRQLRDLYQYSIQCVLNANLFTERVYMFLWLWLLCVAVVTMLSFMVWTLLTLLPFHRQRYIRRFMELADNSCAQVSNQDVSLVTAVIGEDGIMVLKLLSANSSELLVRDVICGISRLVRRGETMLSTGTVMQHAPVAEPLIQPTAPHEVYPSLYKAEG